MGEKIKNILIVVVVGTFLGITLYSTYYNVKYENECTYETETVIGIVTDKETYRRLSYAKPVIYRTDYKTEVTLPDGVKTDFYGSEIYEICQIGDEILIELEHKYHDGELVSTDYKTVVSKQGD